MLKELKAGIKKDISLKAFAKTDPDFVDFRSDPDFRGLVFDEHVYTLVRTTTTKLPRAAASI